jgi:NarL family two-component system sensor histidine kinase LiaS
MWADSFVENKLILFYRYVSLSLTSLVYLIGDSGLSFFYKCAVVLSLFAAAKLISSLYDTAPRKSWQMQAIVGIEMAGILLILLPTGGWSSPFTWYAFNPVLVAALYLSPIFCWLLLGGFYVITTLITFLAFNPRNESFSGLLLDTAQVFLILILTTMAIQVMGQIKRKLEEANRRTNETLENIKSLYQVVEEAAHDHTIGIGQIFTDFAVRLTKLERSFYWFTDEAVPDVREHAQTGWSPEEYSQLVQELEDRRSSWTEQDEPFLADLGAFGKHLIVPVRLSGQLAGLLGVRMEPGLPPEARGWYAKHLIFLAELSSVILKRYEMEQMEARLLIIEEQNRIADEMHDSVSQNLFGIVYASHTLRQLWEMLPDDQIDEHLALIQESANTATHELRRTIYSLSSKKTSGEAWLATVESHVKTLCGLNRVESLFLASGDARLLTPEHQKALYRFISEAVGNSVRHGKCQRVRVDLKLGGEIRVEIADNGCGFDPGHALHTSGLGMKNMQTLVEMLGGHLEVNSKPGEGTRLMARIPLPV